MVQPEREKILLAFYRPYGNTFLGIAAGIKWDDILDTNAEKLFKSNKARYKEGFSDDDANERNLVGEREVLDKLKIKTS